MASASLGVGEGECFRGVVRAKKREKARSVAHSFAVLKTQCKTCKYTA